MLRYHAPRHIRRQFGAESFVTGRNCDIGEIEAAGGDTWKRYCDCAFTGEAKQVVFTCGSRQWALLPDRSGRTTQAVALDNGELVTVSDPNKLGAALCPGSEPRSLVSRVVNLSNSQEYQDCLAKYCAAPAGCDNPAKGPGGKDRFNVHPGMWAAPWTDAGAAARGIRKRNASLWYDVAAATGYDPAPYADPIYMWKVLWTNPALYELLTFKASLVNPPMALCMVAKHVCWLPFVLERCASTGNWDQFFGPTVDGWKTFVTLIYQYLGSCGVGFNYPCGVGIVAQQAARDQIKDGSVNYIGSDLGKAMVYLMANEGAVLMKHATEAATGIEDKGFWEWLKSASRALLPILTEVQGMPKEVLQVVDGVGYAAEIISKVMEARQKGWDTDRTINEVVRAVFGFEPLRIKEFFTAAGSDPMKWKAAKASADAEIKRGLALMAKDHGAFWTSSFGDAMLTFMGDALEQMAVYLDSFNNSPLGLGTLTPLVNQLKESATMVRQFGVDARKAFNDSIDAATPDMPVPERFFSPGIGEARLTLTARGATELRTTGQTAADQTSANAGRVDSDLAALFGQQSPTTGAPRAPATTPTKPTSSTPPLKASGGSSTVAAAVPLTVAGALVGGPVGALVGAIAGMVLGGKK